MGWRLSGATWLAGDDDPDVVSLQRSDVGRIDIGVRDDRVDLAEPEHERGRDLPELGRVGQHDAVPRAVAERPVRQDFRHRVVHQAALGIDGADAHEQRVRPQLAQGQFGQVTEHRVHPRPNDAAEDDQLDAVAVEQHAGHVQGVGDDGQAPIDQPAGQLQGRRTARDGDRLPVLDEIRGRDGDGPLGRDVAVAAPRGGRTPGSAAPP